MFASARPALTPGRSQQTEAYMNRAPLRRSILAGLMLSLPVTSAFADVISDWNERAVTLLLAQSWDRRRQSACWR